jgi:hypothetical protein
MKKPFLWLIAVTILVAGIAGVVSAAAPGDTEQKIKDALGAAPPAGNTQDPRINTTPDPNCVPLGWWKRGTAGCVLQADLAKNSVGQPVYDREGGSIVGHTAAALPFIPLEFRPRTAEIEACAAAYTETVSNRVLPPVAASCRNLLLELGMDRENIDNRR